MGTKGLGLTSISEAPEKPHEQEVEKKSHITAPSPAKDEVNGDMRLAWMFVQGWRQRLLRGEKLVEKHRTECPGEDDEHEHVKHSVPSDGGSSVSPSRSSRRLSYGTLGSVMVIEGKNPAEQRIKKDRSVWRDKSVHWGL
ncbi:hypothetical protein PG995_010505 [Apiospora arundinis]